MKLGTQFKNFFILGITLSTPLAWSYTGGLLGTPIPYPNTPHSYGPGAPTHYPLFDPPMDPAKLVKEVYDNGGYYGTAPVPNDHELPYSNEDSYNNSPVSGESTAVTLPASNGNPKLEINFLSAQEKNASYAVIKDLSKAERAVLSHFMGGDPVDAGLGGKQPLIRLIAEAFNAVEHGNTSGQMVQIPFEKATNFLMVPLWENIGPEGIKKYSDFIQGSFQILESRPANAYFLSLEHNLVGSDGLVFKDIYSLYILDPLEGTAYIVEICRQ